MKSVDVSFREDRAGGERITRSNASSKDLADSYMHDVGHLVVVPDVRMLCMLALGEQTMSVGNTTSHISPHRFGA